MIQLLFVPVAVLGVVGLMLLGLRFIIYWGGWCDRCQKEMLKHEVKTKS